MAYHLDAGLANALVREEAAYVGVLAQKVMQPWLVQNCLFEQEIDCLNLILIGK